ncbi:MAG: transposase [Planctomycetaceae bacterium]
MQSACELLHPQVAYHQVVFTLPQQLAQLALGNRRVMYTLLFQSAWETLRTTIHDEQQYEAAALLVLHTWNQQLEHHPHVHAVVPSGGPSRKNVGEWKTATPPRDRAWITNWLVDAETLKSSFRTTFLKGLQRLHRRGELKLQGEWSHLTTAAAFESWLQPLEDLTWVVHIEAPPQNSVPSNVVKYLARYLTGGPISDGRLISHDNGQVKFWARRGTTPGGDRQDMIAVCLSGEEFVRRWSLHILPKGLVKTRRYGGWSNRHQQAYRARCDELLNTDVSVDAESPDSPAESRAGVDPYCRHCGTTLSLVSSSNRPSWRVVMASPVRPEWYERVWSARVVREWLNERRSNQPAIQQSRMDDSRGGECALSVAM